MSTGDTWDDLINEKESEYFVGREQELDLFRQEIHLPRPHSIIFYITGQGGVGKSTLLGRYREMALASGFLLADTDEQQRDVPSVLGRFAHQFSEQGIQLKRFNERYKTYRQKMDEIENDPQAPQGLAAALSRTFVRASYIMGDMLPGVRKGLEYFPRESVETHASELTDYIARKLTNKDEVALVRDPTAVLTPLFFEDLNEHARKHRFLLCFENFEDTRQSLQIWLLRLREYKPSLNILLAIAGRNLPGAQWDTLRRVTRIIQLDIFTEPEANAFLDASHIYNAQRRADILAFSKRLPVLMSWLSTPEGPGDDLVFSTHDIVERFLRWIPDSSFRHIVLVGAIPRSFNQDILTCLLSQKSQPLDMQTTFEWLQTMPFVRQQDYGWRYHDVVRSLMLRYQRDSSPQAYRQLHAALAQLSDERRHALSKTEEDRWTNEFWRAETLVWAYHAIIADAQTYWIEVLNLLVLSIRKHRNFALTLVEYLDHEDLHIELTLSQKQTLQLINQQLQAIEQGSLSDGFEMFDTLCRASDLSPQAKGCMFACRGEFFVLQKRYEQALIDFNNVFIYGEKDAMALIMRGITYYGLERYGEALIDFDHAIALDGDNVWALTMRGMTHYGLERYGEALIDFDHAIALDEDNVWAIKRRGATYQELERYEEALVDFDRALAFDGDNVWVLKRRGETYQELKQYEEALADFNRVITLDEDNVWALTMRGMTYQLLKRYEEALADFNCAIALDEGDSDAITMRGITYQELKRYEKALVDFDRLIALDENNVWAIKRRGATYRRLGRHEEALVDFDRAIALNGDNDVALMMRGLTYQELERYEEALVDFDRVIALNGDNDVALMMREETYQLIKGID